MVGVSVLQMEFDSWKVLDAEDGVMKKMMMMKHSSVRRELRFCRCKGHASEIVVMLMLVVTERTIGGSVKPKGDETFWFNIIAVDDGFGGLLSGKLGRLVGLDDETVVRFQENRRA